MRLLFKYNQNSLHRNVSIIPHERSVLPYLYFKLRAQWLLGILVEFAKTDVKLSLVFNLIFFKLRLVKDDEYGRVVILGVEGHNNARKEVPLVGLLRVVPLFSGVS